MARYTVHTVNGPKRRHVYGKTRQETAAKLAKVLSDRTDGVVYDDENMTVSEYLDRWLDGSVRQSTYERDAYLVEKHINPALGRIKLKNLSAVHVQSFYRDRLDHGLSPSTVHKVYTILHKALLRAVAWQMISRNVTEVVEPPKPTPGKIRPLSPAEARKLLDAARGERFEGLYVLAVTTGMRLGELLALKWQDVDLENATVSVRRTLTRTGGRYTLGEPKTKKSGRSIRLTPQAKEVLRQHLERQLWDIRMRGDTYTDHGLVFTTDTGASLNPSNMRQRSLVS